MEEDDENNTPDFLKNIKTNDADEKIRRLSRLTGSINQKQDYMENIEVEEGAVIVNFNQRPISGLAFDKSYQNLVQSQNNTNKLNMLNEVQQRAAAATLKKDINFQRRYSHTDISIEINQQKKDQ